MVRRHANPRQIDVICENIDCERPESISLTPSEFEDWLGKGEFACGDCGHEFSIDNLNVVCALCTADIHYLDLSHLANDILCDPCPECAARWGVDEFRTVFVEGSWSEAHFIYDWTRSGRRIDVLERRGRTDYWEGLVHFCTAEEFVSIYRQRRIGASSTGLYGKRNPSATKAVCLTEATMPNWEDLKESHGEYGFVFRKRDIIGVSGAPAIYLPQSVLNELSQKRQRIPETLWPYLNKLTIPSVNHGVKHDFLHEREWRVPQDIDFAAVRPYAITFPKSRPGIADEELILHAAREFQELSDGVASTV